MENNKNPENSKRLLPKRIPWELSLLTVEEERKIGRMLNLKEFEELSWKYNEELKKRGEPELEEIKQSR